MKSQGSEVNYLDFEEDDDDLMGEDEGKGGERLGDDDYERFGL